MLNYAQYCRGIRERFNKEFAYFLNVAKGSAGEVRSILYILLDNEYIDAPSFEKLEKELSNISAQLSNFRKFLIGNPKI